VREAGEPAPDCGQGGVVVLASGRRWGQHAHGGREGGTARGGGLPKWDARMELRRTGHQCAGTPVQRGQTALEHHGPRWWLPTGESQGGTGVWTRLTAVAPHGR
jgi:hypothetical protein